MKIELPKKVSIIIDKLYSCGYEAYAVGGCVRDSILGREPGDWDITTCAKPEQVKQIFHRTVDTGIEHGTVTVLMDGEGFEVTTYRIDGEYEDNRHPKQVDFTSELVADLKRRDFTINAMAYNSKEGLVDVFGGKEDLERKVIRCVGEPEERFTEDALRIMRAVRFSAQLGFVIEEKTRSAIERLAGNLAFISAERIQTELVKTMVSDNPDYFRDAYKLGITKVIMPEFDQMMEYDHKVGDQVLKALTLIENKKYLRLAVLLSKLRVDVPQGEKVISDLDIGWSYQAYAAVSERTAKAILRRLKFDNYTMRKVCRLVKWHSHQIQLSPRSVRYGVYYIGEDLFQDYIQLRKAFLAGLQEMNYNGFSAISPQAAEFEKLETLKHLYSKEIEENNCFSLKQLAIGGKDLVELGIKPGKHIGEILDILLFEILDHPDDNNKMYLLQRVAALIKNQNI